MTNRASVRCKQVFLSPFLALLFAKMSFQSVPVLH